MILSAWLISCVLSLTPLLALYFTNQPLNNAMCVTILCFDLLDEWIVIIIYLFNTIITVSNVALNVAVIIAVYKMQHRKEFVNVKRKTEQSVTVRLVLLIFINSSCWLVLGTVGLLHMTGVWFSARMFAGIVTVVLPINTLLNPFLNVFTTKEFIDTISKRFK